MGSTAGPGVLFGIAVKLFLISDTNALDLSNMRIAFKTTANDSESLNKAYIRVYNLSPQTVAEAISEYSSVSLSAGFEGNIGQIFKGTITKFIKGHERNVDSFLDIYAADGDLLYNFGMVNASIPAGSTPLQQVQTIASSIGATLDGAAADQLESATQDFGGILPRGKVLFGLARSFMRDLAGYGFRWSIQNGVLTVIANDSFLPGDPVKLNSQTGMIGFPESTQQGINVKTLINSQIRVGGQVQINNADITTATIKNAALNTINEGIADSLYATVDKSADGLYRVIVIEHQGDTRANEWSSSLVCLRINQNPQAGTPAVLPFG